MKKLIILLVLVAFACSTFIACAAVQKCEQEFKDCDKACEKASDIDSGVDVDYSSCQDKCSEEEDKCKSAAGCSGS